MAEGIYNLTDVIFCFGGWTGPRMQCGFLRNEDVYEQLNQMEMTVPPRGGCMQYYCHFILALNPRKIHDDMKRQRTLYVVNKNPFYMKCPCGATRPTVLDDSMTKTKTAEQCFHNIECGKCIDPYIIEVIGKRFFADKYAQKRM